MANKYNYELGKIFDTAFCLTTYLFEDEIFRKFFVEFKDSFNMNYDMRFYAEIKEKFPSFSELIIPFCYYNNERYKVPFLIDYINNRLNINDIFYTFIPSIDVLSFKTDFINWYFPDATKHEFQSLYEAKDIVSVFNILSKTNIPDKYKIIFMTVIFDFDRAKIELNNALNKVYTYVNQVHNLNSNVSKGIINNVENIENDSAEKLDRLFALHDKKSHIYTFSLLNLYDIFYIQTQNHYIFILGEKYLLSLTNSSDYCHITVQSFAKMVASGTRFDIFNMFFEYKNLCAADVAHYLKLTKPTVYTHLEEMEKEKFLIFADTHSSKAYYTLNENYLIKFSEYMNKMTDKYMKLKKEDKLKLYILIRKRRKDYQE